MEAFSERLVNRLEAMEGGDPLDRETQMMGSIINEREVD